MAKTQVNERLAAHVKNLGLKNVDQYRLWCNNNGFQSSLAKTEREMKTEISYFKASKVHLNLKNKLDPKKDLIKKIKDIKNGSSFFIPIEVDFLKNYDGQEFITVKNLILSLAKNGVLFESISNVSTRYGEIINHLSLYKFINKLHNYINRFQRSFSSWKPKSHNPKRLAISLLEHLFVQYKIPSFMNEIWFDPARRSDAWVPVYFHMAKGYGIKNFDLPVTYKATKKVSHYFNTAPNDFTPEEALVWARVHALGGSSRLGNIAKQSRIIVQDWGNVNFWDSVLKWFLENPMLDLVHFGPIVDYIRNKKFIARDQPNLTMKGRNADTLLKEVDLWHTGIKASETNRAWPSFNIFNNYERETGKDEHKTFWVIREIKTEKELVQEGRSMRHCVGSYAHSCIRGAVSIWSMTSKNMGNTKNELTIEVRNSEKRIVQARGYANAFPSSTVRWHMEQWAYENGIGFSSYM